MSRLVHYDSNGNEIFDPPKADVIKTNADRIRAMTDEELAKNITKMICDGVAAVFPLATYSEKGIKELSEDWLGWLKQEAEE